MKIKTFAFMALITATAVLSSCENGDVEYGDYDYQTIYFARQTPVRTLVMGDDIYDNTLDNAHQFQVLATLGGVESNDEDRVVQFVVDTTLCDSITFSDGSAVVPLPESYYTLSNANTFTIPSGKVIGGITVQLTDAFFEDEKATSINYVLPVRLTAASDSILSGVAKDGVTNPNILNSDDWSTQPKNYTLYAVKYKNKWHGIWLSHGTDVIDDNGTVTTVTRDSDYVEHYETREITTISLTKACYPLSTTVTRVLSDNSTSIETMTCNLILSFDDNGQCTITTNSDSCTASGSGQWTSKGAKQAWGGKDRDLLQLDYVVTYHYTSNGQDAYKKYTCHDELIFRDHEEKLEDFSYILK